MTLAVVTRGPHRFQQRPASHVVPVGTIGHRDQRAGIHDQHLIAPNPGQRLGDGVIQMERYCHDPSVTAHARAGIIIAAIGGKS